MNTIVIKPITMRFRLKPLIRKVRITLKRGHFLKGMKPIKDAWESK